MKPATAVICDICDEELKPDLKDKSSSIAAKDSWVQFVYEGSTVDVHVRCLGRLLPRKAYRRDQQEQA